MNLKNSQVFDERSESDWYAFKTVQLVETSEASLTGTNHQTVSVFDCYIASVSFSMLHSACYITSDNFSMFHAVCSLCSTPSVNVRLLIPSLRFRLTSSGCYIRLSASVCYIRFCYTTYASSGCSIPSALLPLLMAAWQYPGISCVCDTPPGPLRLLDSFGISRMLHPVCYVPSAVNEPQNQSGVRRAKRV